MEYSGPFNKLQVGKGGLPPLNSLYTQPWMVAIVERGQATLPNLQFIELNCGTKIVSDYTATHVPRFRNLPSPALPLYSPFSITTLPRESTVSTTPFIFLPSYAL